MSADTLSQSPDSLPSKLGGIPGRPVLAQTKAGTVRGFWRDNAGWPTAAFLGIPFAQPPVGPLRFEAPQPVEPWEGVRDAYDYGATALRHDPGDTLIPEPAVPGECTLNVNVFTPAPGDKRACLPVLVYIHGGGFTAGSPASPWYDGSAFNRDGVVTVTISYRLGFIGFGWVEGAPQNRGVLDWLAALTWVRDNIAAFGGDPHDVTIAGQSAGGGAVLTLLGMDRAQPLFHRAFSISGAIADVSREEARGFSQKIADSLGVPATKEGFGQVSEADLIAAQEAVVFTTSVPDLLRALTKGLSIGPVVDGRLITRRTFDSIDSGVGADKHVMLGATLDEFSGALVEQQERLRWIPRRLLLKFAGITGQRYSSYLRANKDVATRGNGHLLGRVTTDSIFRSTVVKVAQARGNAPTWVYQFLYAQPTSGLSIHCIDVPFWFDCLNAPRVTTLAGEDAPQALADTVHASAVRFIREGDPGWERWTAADRAVKLFADPPADLQLGGYEEVLPLLS